jgi:hypothetical protein
MHAHKTTGLTVQIWLPAPQQAHTTTKTTDERLFGKIAPVSQILKTRLANHYSTTILYSPFGFAERSA